MAQAIPLLRKAGPREFWLAGIRKRWADPLVIWSVRDPQSIRESFNAAGWTGAPWEHRLERAKAIYEAYDGPKLIIEHERLAEAMQLFDPARAGRLS